MKYKTWLRKTADWRPFWIFQLLGNVNGMSSEQSAMLYLIFSSGPWILRTKLLRIPEQRRVESINSIRNYRSSKKLLAQLQPRAYSCLPRYGRIMFQSLRYIWAKWSSSPLFRCSHFCFLSLLRGDLPLFESEMITLFIFFVRHLKHPMHISILFVYPPNMNRFSWEIS